MDRMFFNLVITAALMCPVSGSASGLVPEDCTIGDRPVCCPIEEVGFMFDGAISIAEGRAATVYSGNDPVATGTLSASNYIWEKRTQGTALVTFESPLVLPKGKTYRLVVPDGAICREDDPSQTNDELCVELDVPASLGQASPSVREGSSMEYAGRIGFYFRFETAPVQGARALLLREGIPVREYDCDVRWDWDLGYAGIDFGGTVHFEKGVEYAVMLPEGSVSALHRPDIVNDEAVVHFTGSYTEPPEPIDYVWCSLFTEHPADVLGVVRFYYDRPVALAPDPVVQLYLGYGDPALKEVVPTLSAEDGRWVLAADFENTPLTSVERFSIVIPEGTLVTPEGDVAVNQRNVLNLGDVCGISDTKVAEYNINVENGSLVIANTSMGKKSYCIPSPERLCIVRCPMAEAYRSP